ncbi:MAG: EamA family transporter [Terriglobales bacterium]
MTPAERQHRFRVILCFALVYLFWGSTYLAIRIAVRQIPPALMAGTRFLIAGSLMLAYCALSGRRVRLSRAEAARVFVLAVLLLTVSNVILCWAEQWVPSGLAALIVSVTPLWFLALETWVLPGEHHASPRAVTGLLLGVAGIVVLLWPQLRHTTGLGKWQLIGSVSLLGGSLSWAIGSVLSKRWKISLDAFSATAWEMTFAGFVNVLIGVSLGEPRTAVWSARSVGAVLYLVVFGSWVGFTAYIWLLNHVPTAKLATYAYVNPVIAVFLGWLVLREQITVYILTGAAIVVAAVSLVTGAKLRVRETAEPELPAVESTG